MKAINLKPIETVYKGYRFRSRLEARWAVYFDVIGIQWEYEPEGYTNGFIKYLPDFWLPQVNMWAEVKPGKFTDKDINKIEMLVRGTNHPCLLLDGPLDLKTYDSIEFNGFDDIPPPLDLINVDYLITMYHQYPLNEGRFYCMPGERLDTVDDFVAGGFEDIVEGVLASRRARFEFGENNYAS